MKLLKEHIKETLALAIPVSIGQFGHILMGIVDSLMVGRLGTEPLAAAALVNGLFFLVLVLGIGMSLALTPLVAIAKGSSKYENCSEILKNGFHVNFIFAIILTILIFFGSDLINYLDQPKQVSILAISYLKILSLSVIPFLLFQIFRQFIEGLSYVRPPMIIAIAANIFNAFFNWVLIFGNLGFQPMGLDGAGVATTTTRSLMAIVLIIYVMKAKHLKSYTTIKNFFSYDKKLVTKLLKIGLPSGFQYFLEVAAFSFAAIMIGWMGATQLAAHQIGINLASATYMIILGISSAGMIRVAQAAGKKDIEETRAAGFTALIVAIAIMIFFGIMFILLKNILPHFYIEDKEVIELASSLLMIAAIFQIFDGMQATAIGILRGLKDVNIPMILSFLGYWILGIGSGYVFGFVLDLKAFGIWIGLALALMGVGITLTLRFNFKSKMIIDD